MPDLIILPDDTNKEEGARSGILVRFRSSELRRDAPPQRLQGELAGNRDSGRCRGPEADAISIRVAHIELAHAPSLVHRGDVYADILCDEFLMQRVHIAAREIDHAADHAVAGMRGKAENGSVAITV